MVKTVDLVKTTYPKLAHILDEDTLAEISCIESKEREFIQKTANPLQQYLRALYLKSMRYLGHCRFNPGRMPLQLRMRLIDELALPRSLISTRRIARSKKNNIIRDVRAFLGMTKCNQTVLDQLRDRLIKETAAEEGDIITVVNAAVAYLRAQSIELPAFTVISNVCAKALRIADENLMDRLGSCLAQRTCKGLDALLKSKGTRTQFDQFKQDIGSAGPKEILKALGQLEQIGQYPLDAPVLRKLTRRKIDSFALLGWKNNAAELDHLKPGRKRIILLCFLRKRRSELLDLTAELVIRYWNDIQAQSNREANEYKAQLAIAQEDHQIVLENLLAIICHNKSNREMARRIRKHKSPEQYEALLQEVKTSITWKDIYHGKLADHYTALRRFLPKLYEALPLVSNTTDDSLIRGIDFLKRHAKTNQPTLAGHGVPTEFLTAEWKRRALKTHTWAERTIVSIQKAPYELAVVDTMVKAFETGALSIENANRYGPLIQHLIPRQQFISGYLQYLKKLGQPEAVCDYYAALRQDLEQSMLRFDDDYQNLQDSFRINRNGTLSYKKTPPQIVTARLERLSETIQPYLPSVTILDVLLDIHALTGFMNHLKPINGRQSMSEDERILRLLATIYAYGCNCGPAQAAQSIGLRKQDLLYMRRHYCGIKQLTEAASVLADTYGTTAMAKHLGDPGIFMTDAMRFPALKKSLTARHHFRYGSGKSILLYQHVTANCICLFTQALLCNVSEAIHMLNGIMKHRTGMEPVINICDNAGKSDLVFGLAHLLNIQIWPRVRGRQNLKLWAPARKNNYKNIAKAIAGEIRWDLIEKGWPDAMWILASIMEGTVSPSLISDILASQPNNPAFLAISELGKLVRSNYLLKYGMQDELRALITRYTSRREHWNSFSRKLFSGFGGMVREKSQEGQNELFWFLTVVQNAVVLWNALALEQAINKARADGIVITDEDLNHILPTKTGHINLVGEFNVDLHRKPPFRLAA